MLFCRLYLAALYYNENAGRTQATTKHSVNHYSIAFPKHFFYFTEYIEELFDNLMEEVLKRRTKHEHDNVTEPPPRAVACANSNEDMYHTVNTKYPSKPRICWWPISPY